MGNTNTKTGQFIGGDGSKIIHCAPLDTLSKGEAVILAKMQQKKIKDFSYAEMYRVFAPPVATLICFRLVDNMIKAGRLWITDASTEIRELFHKLA